MSVCSPNYGTDGNFPYRWCIVPECESSSVKTPKKIWIEAPTDVDTRMKWLNLAFRDSKKLPISKNQMYFCEDHFDLENDMEIYDQNKTMGPEDQVWIKPNCVPTRFNYQKDGIKTTTSHQQPQYLVYSKNIPKNINPRHNYRPSNFSTVIPGTNRRKTPVKYYNATIPHTIRIKPNIRNDRIYNIEKNEAKDKTKKDPTPKTSEKKDIQTKFIKEAFKIINSNQNSESINLLANSVQNLSSTLLSEMISSNFDLGSKYDTTLPAEISISSNETLTSNITTTSTENITQVKEENAFIADAINVDVTPVISTENITDVKEENAFQDDSVNVPTKDTEYFTYNLKEIAFKAEPSNKATNLAISSENLMNILEEISFKAESSNNTLNSSSPTENKNRADSTDMGINQAMSTEKLTTKKTEKKTPGSYSINFTNSTMSIEELTNIIKDDERITCDTYGFDNDDGLDENIAGEELNQPVTEETEKQEYVEGDKSKVQPDGTPIALDGPILGENIKQLTLTREQLIEERAHTATSQAYLRAPHKCESCIIGFHFHENLEDHFKRKHTRMPGKRRHIICDVCQQFVEHGAIYNMHTFYHHTRYQCVVCEQLFASYDTAARHYRRQHCELRYRPKEAVTCKCHRCPYKTGRKRLLKDHKSECCTCKQCGVSIGTMADISPETHLIYCTGAPSEPKRAKPTPTSTATETSLED